MNGIRRVMRVNALWPGGAGGTFTNNLASPGWGAYFADPNVLVPLLPYFDVLGIPWVPTDNTNFGSGGPGRIWVNLFQILTKAGKGVQFEAGYIDSTAAVSPGGNNGNAIAANDKNSIAQMLALGSPLPEVIMDGFPNLMAEQCNSLFTVPTYTTGNMTGELVNYFTSMLATYPNLTIGIDVNLGEWIYNGQTAYIGPNGTAGTRGGPTTIGSQVGVYFNFALMPDYKTLFQAMLTALSGAALPAFAYLHSDFPYDQMEGFLTSNWTGAANFQWLQNVLIPLQFQAQTAGVKFAPQFNSFSTGNTGPDSRWYYEVLDFQKAYLAAGGMPDGLVMNSFGNFPATFLPADGTNPFSIGSTMRALASSDPTSTPVWQLFNASSLPQFIMVTKMADRAFFLRGGFADQGIICYLPSGLMQWTKQPNLTLLQRLTQGVNTLLTPSQSFAQTLAAAGWSLQPSSAYGSLLAIPPS